MEESEAICSQRKPSLAQFRPSLPHALGPGKVGGDLGAAGKEVGESTIHSPALIQRVRPVQGSLGLRAVPRRQLKQFLSQRYLICCSVGFFKSFLKNCGKIHNIKFAIVTIFEVPTSLA